jgi:membrane associated rhomboid family serine protease
MPICPDCGKKFSGISFGARPATECPDCRKAKGESAAAARGYRRLDPYSAPPNIPYAAVPSVRYSVALPPAVTLSLIGINVAVYLAMGISGASWTDPSIVDAVKWGADFGPLTLSSDWWRLFTSTFVHFGIIHIALNMWCLWNLGTTLEPFMCREVFGVMYVASGLAASLVSTAWNPWRVSAGASGAIFGVAGALVSYFALKKTPLDRALVKRNLRSLGIFIFYNLLYGVSGGVDNSAHLGGLVAGLILGAAIPPMVRAPADPQYIPVGPPDLGREADESRANRVAFTVAAVSAIVLIVAFATLRKERIGVARYGSAVQLIKAGKPDQAVAPLQESVKLDPGVYYSQAMLGELLLLQQNPEAAVGPLERVAIMFPNAYDVQHNLALAYLGAARAGDSLPLINKSLAAQKNDTWPSLFVRGAAEAEVADDALASADFRAVVQAKPDLAEPKQLLAQIPETGAPATKPQIAIPYDKLVMKSEFWPLYP